MAILRKLKTADNLQSRGIVVPLACSFCHGYPENHSHLFFGCDFSFTILTRLLPDLNCFLLKPTIAQIFEFLEHSLIYNRLEKNFCYLTVSCTIYHIWRERNNRCFSNLNTNSVKILCIIYADIRLKVSKWQNKDMLLRRFNGI
ncbi:hypothetical protein MA16_Dca022965 [Dendrobium catenatum]|uniref:Reverse transcriptase zinc-binding domain-containing protein n=1 Tax=Dendrobium catenatum TaxID=906689 RepID=A0A2I0VXC5_9ASPA|nr:hypothetical protein MA16_Dca022965 [Dendrobium catenatum]